MLNTLLNCQSLPQDWHCSYGVTIGRTTALTRAASDSNSLFNRRSETALSLFALGNLDRWGQIGKLTATPRDGQSRWNEQWFTDLRSGKLPYNAAAYKAECWGEFLRAYFPNDRLPKNSVLLFELEIMNQAFHPAKGDRTKAFNCLSFLQIPDHKAWSQFDAVLIAPQEQKGLLYFIEAKLGSDVSLGTTAYPYVNQIVRNLEAAFLLTNHDDSQYKGWDFRYLLVCPRKPLQYRATYYACVLGTTPLPAGKVGELLDCYRSLLTTEYAGKQSPEFAAYFDAFRREAPSRVAVTDWTTVGDELKRQHGVSFFQEYLTKLAQPGGLQSDQLLAIRSRMLDAALF